MSIRPPSVAQSHPCTVCPGHWLSHRCKGCAGQASWWYCGPGLGEAHWGNLVAVTFAQPLLCARNCVWIMCQCVGLSGNETCPCLHGGGRRRSGNTVSWSPPKLCALEGPFPHYKGSAMCQPFPAQMTFPSLPLLSPMLTHWVWEAPSWRQVDMR